MTLPHNHPNNDRSDCLECSIIVLRDFSENPWGDKADTADIYAAFRVMCKAIANFIDEARRHTDIGYVQGRRAVADMVAFLPVARAIAPDRSINLTRDEKRRLEAGEGDTVPPV